jgi:glycosyltransferase involved in cell wall biosynthesis
MMRILYHLTVLPPQMPECEALSQEIRALRDRFGGDLVYLNPNPRTPLYLPRLVFGFHKLRELRSREKDLDLHHLYNPDPFPFPILHKLRCPVIYSISSGLGSKRLNTGFFASLAAVTVYDERSFQRLRAWGLDNVFLVRSGIDKSRFTYSPTPLESEIRLMVGSAPWTRAQFRTKGVQALLSAAQRAPHLRLVFLWRGILIEEMERRVRRMKLERQVTILNGQVDVNQVLVNVHASITLATDAAIIKAYPHSLMESLAAGKPVIVSRCIPMADVVEQKSCGKVVENIAPDHILTAIQALMDEYKTLQDSAQRVGKQEFSQEAMINSFHQVYQQVLNRSHL